MEITDINNNAEHETRRSFSWDGAFLASDGFLASEELSNMIEGDELQKIEEIENMEAKLFQEIKASTKKSTKTSNATSSSINLSPKNKDSQAKKVTGSSGPHKVAPVKTPPKMTSKTDTNKAEPPLKTLPAVRTKPKVGSVNTTNTRVSRTSPTSPVSPGSAGSAFGFSQRSKVIGIAPRRYSVINERPSTINVKRNNDQKATKRGASVIPKMQSSASLKIKPTPVNSHSSSPSSSTTQRLSESSSSRSIKSSNAHQISKPALKNHPTKQPAKTAATTNTGAGSLKPNSPIATTPKKQPSPKAKASSSENIFIISPEILELQCKIKALKMGIDMHKKDRFSKMAGAVRVEVT